MDFAFNYPLWDAVLRSIQARNPSDLAFALEQDSRLYPEGANLATFISNHDQIRPATSLSPLRRDVERLKLAAGLLLTLPGTPYIYYGEEIGLPSGSGGKDEEKRTPMRWDADMPFAGFSTAQPWYVFSTDDPEISVAAQQAEPDSLLNWYKLLIRLRTEIPALSQGKIEVLETDDRALFAFTRIAEAESILVLANFGNEALSFDIEILASSAVDLVSMEEIEGILELPKLGFKVLELRSR